MRWISLALLVALAGCDSQAPPESAEAAATLASVKADDGALYAVTEAVRVATEGEAVVLHLGGEAVALSAGEAYLLGQALSRAGYRTLDPKVAADIRPPRGGDKCEPPPPGMAVAAVDGRLFGGGGTCPPPPPPIFMEHGLLDALVGGEVKIVEAPEGAEWTDIPGGFVAEW